MGKRKSSLFLKHFIPSKGVSQPFIPVLDENIHTPAAVLSRCPFLFTVGLFSFDSFSIRRLLTQLSCSLCTGLSVLR